ncbi:PAAR domain-containing protein [Morganella morganii]|uniref:PAAR domain-containing protein n=1 Tax=Morganella morganii TaxID=582 RepID=UPI003BB19DE7
MAGKQVICLGDTTDHGGVVISALDNYTVNGRPVATEGIQSPAQNAKVSFRLLPVLPS